MHTLHGPFDDDACRFYGEHGHKACIVAISQAQLDDAPPAMGGGVVVHNPIDVGEWPWRGGEGRLPALDRPHVARQGCPTARAAAAREAGVPPA